MDITETRKLDAWDGFVDWKNRPALRGRHGGMTAASFVLGVEVLENLAFLANASNLVLYLTRFMGFSPSVAATTVTNFMGTAFLLALLGGFVADAFFTTYSIYLISSVIEFIGLLILTVQAQVPYLKPSSTCSSSTTTCQEVDGLKQAILFSGLYLVALGVGGIKGSLPPHGAQQFEETTPQGRLQRSAFFNYFVFCLSFGALIAVTLVVWLEDTKGWQWGFGVSTVTILISIPLFLLGSRFYRTKVPTGSPITTLLKVLAAAICNSFQFRNSGNGVTSRTGEKESCSFLDAALLDNPCHPNLKCTTKQVEEVKVVTKMLPIFVSTIMLNACLAQLSTFSVQQAATMDTSLGSFKVPPASLPVFPILFIMALAPIYSHVIAPFARKATRTESGFTHLQRIGAGLALSVVAMAVAALVEAKRRSVALEAPELVAGSPLPMTFLWVAIQYLFLGSADLFTLAGTMEFFFTEAPETMRSLATALSWASLAFGYYLSSVLVPIVNCVTSALGGAAWLSGANLNQYRLEKFYWLMCALSGLNFLHYLFWASRYKYSSSVSG